MDNSNIEIVGKFFEQLKNDEELKKKLDDAVMNYPGSLEIPESVCEATLIPIAAEAGYPFTIKDLKRYELRLKMQQNKDVEITDDEPEDGPEYWLIDRGWSYDTDLFTNDKEEQT